MGFSDWLHNVQPALSDVSDSSDQVVARYQGGIGLVSKVPVSDSGHEIGASGSTVSYVAASKVVSSAAPH